ncbi:hypothetical protein LCGC14_0420450 [marine sediment metagenome]|uniref:Uncharacterized protein n=1 Tax=marine sediment metagenome TaxID=412755 RepID=A0A0F9VD26_9ZZZZ
MKLQFVWWWRFPTIKFWAYPRSFKQHNALKGKPMFYGLYLGILEIRYFPLRIGKVEDEG